MPRRDRFVTPGTFSVEFTVHENLTTTGYGQGVVKWAAQDCEKSADFFFVLNLAKRAEILREFHETLCSENLATSQCALVRCCHQGVPTFPASSDALEILLYFLNG